MYIPENVGAKVVVLLEIGTGTHVRITQENLLMKECVQILQYQLHCKQLGSTCESKFHILCTFSRYTKNTRRPIR